MNRRENKTGLVANIIERGGDEWKRFKLLMCNIPSMVVALFVVSVVLMNMLANKEIKTSMEWLVLDCGTTVSWLSFLAMDMITKRFGAKAAVEVSVFAIVCNLLVSALMVVAAMLPGNWGAFYDYGLIEINAALNSTFSGTWYITLGSMTAFFISSIVNASTNSLLGSLFTKPGFTTFAIRSWVSTLIAQFVDNFTFAVIVSRVFFGWTMTQVIVCSLTGCIVELLCEIVFSPIGYRVSNRWEADNIGKQYLEVK